MYNVSQTIISQYANSPILTALIQDMNEWVDPAVNLETFYSYVWDINTASGFGLDNWGKILGVSRYLQLPSVGAYFGFTESGNDWAPFNQAPFYTGGSTSSAYALTDSAYRTLLLAKALANISNCSLQTLNKLAQAIFGSGAMCVIDMGSMAMAYVFATTPSSVDQAIAQNSGVLPRPTGVLISVRTALLFNATLTAGTSGTQAGFVLSSYGTLSPDTDLNSHTVSAMYYDSSGPSFTLSIQSAADLGVNYLNSLTIGGKTLNASNATRSFASGATTWAWASPHYIALTNAAQYSALIS